MGKKRKLNAHRLVMQLHATKEDMCSAAGDEFKHELDMRVTSGVNSSADVQKITAAACRDSKLPKAL